MTDLQDLPIICFCGLCGQEIYPGGVSILLEGKRCCPRCAARRHRLEEKEGEK